MYNRNIAQRQTNEGKNNMIKITLLGDSIREQYAPHVRNLLGKDFEIFEPQENCRFSKYTLRGLYDWQVDMRGSRIVHWNNGMWDCCDLLGEGLFTREDEYVVNMLRIADILLERFGTVIFATTTAVKDNNAFNENDNIIRYNEIIVPPLREKGVIINDLHSLVVSNKDAYISDDLVHLTEAGVKACAKQVADVILKAAENLTDENAPSFDWDDKNRKGAPILFR